MRTKIRITLTAVAAAAALTAGTTAAVAASSPAAAQPRHSATGFSWTPLHLVGGWTAESPSVYGTPAFAVQNGVLYLRGILSAPKSPLPEVAVLPKGARPAHYLWLSYFNFGAVNVGEMEIEPGGSIDIYSSTTGGPPVDPSLQTISFPLSS